MMREKIFIIATIIAGTSMPLFADSNQEALESEKLLAQKNQNGYTYSDQSMTSPGDCSDMSQDEQDFASQLNDSNSKMFCSKMTPMQRQKAMQMTGMRGPSGTKMSPDDAVQNVMKNSGMPAGKGPRASGACPVQ